MNKEDFPFEYHIMIEDYFDNALSKEQEVLLFSVLSQNPEAREYFKQMNIIKQAVSATTDEVPSELDEKILSSIYKAEPRKSKSFLIRRYMPAMAYAAVLIMLLLSSFLFSRASEYKARNEEYTKIISLQNETIELLFHSLPLSEVKSETVNEITNTKL